MLIRDVEVIDRDQTLWYGDGLARVVLAAIPFEQNALKFSYAAPVFAEPESTVYQVMLEGYQKTWSKWTTESYKEYSGIPGGKYVFKVRARDVYGNVSEPAELPLVILTPWYQKWWAYVLYLLLFAALLYLFVKWRVGVFKRKAEVLEGIVLERTAEIARQADELKEMDRIKAHFFANISHEFRTPLTLILGPVESMLERSGEGENKKQLDVVRRNGYRLKRLIDQLLYLSKLEAKQLKLRVHHGDLELFVNQVVQMFASAAEQRGIELMFEVLRPFQEEAYFDPDVVEKVLYNLLSNALKFTPEDGQVKVSIDAGKDVTIRVTDTGCGIAPEQLPNIFNRFYQNDRSKNDFQEGTGIGMALTKELLELHRGGISVESELGKGTVFTVKLPVDIRVFDAAQIVAGAVDEEIDAHVELSDVVAGSSLPETEVEVNGDEKLILVVEDHSQVRDYIRAPFGRKLQGYRSRKRSCWTGECVGCDPGSDHQ